MLNLAASVAVFVAIVVGAVLIAGPGGLRRGPADKRLRDLRSPGGAADRDAVGPSLRRGYSSIPALRQVLGTSDWAERAASDLQQADLQLRPGEYLLGRVLFAAIAFIVPVLIMRMHPVGIVIALGAAAAAYLAPAVYLRHLRTRRVAKIEKQLVEFLPMLASSLRAGFAFQQGAEMASRQMEPPLATELELFINDVNLGANIESALLDLGKRVSSTDLDMMVTAILVQRSTGGNLAEVLDRASETLRERERIRGDIQTLTAQQRLTGLILSIYPAAIGLLLLLVMPSMWSLMFTETAGRVMLGLAFSLQVIGFFAMRRVMQIQI